MDFTNTIARLDSVSYSRPLILKSPMDSYGMQKASDTSVNDLQGQAFWFLRLGCFLS